MADTAIDWGLKIAKGRSGALTALKKLDNASTFLSIGEMYVSAYQDAGDPSLKAGTKIGRTSENIGLFALGLAFPPAGIAIGIAQSVLPTQTQAALDAPLQAAGNGLGSLIYAGISATPLNGWFQRWSSTPSWLDY
jgi:hypothetical protein